MQCQASKSAIARFDLDQTLSDWGRAVSPGLSIVFGPVASRQTRVRSHNMTNRSRCFATQITRGFSFLAAMSPERQRATDICAYTLLPLGIARPNQEGAMRVVLVVWTACLITILIVAGHHRHPGG